MAPAATVLHGDATLEKPLYEPCAAAGALSAAGPSARRTQARPAARAPHRAPHRPQPFARRQPVAVAQAAAAVARQPAAPARLLARLIARSHFPALRWLEAHPALPVSALAL